MRQSYVTSGTDEQAFIAYARRNCINEITSIHFHRIGEKCRNRGCYSLVPSRTNGK